MQPVALGAWPLAAGGFAASAMLAVLCPSGLRRQRAIVPALALIAGIGGALASPAATGFPALDAVLRASLCAGTVALARGRRMGRPNRHGPGPSMTRRWSVRRARAAANRWAVALSGVIVLAASGSWPARAMAAGALGLVLGAAAARLDAPVVRAVAIGLVGQAALRLTGPAEPRHSAYAAAAAFALLAVAGLVALHRRGRRIAFRTGLVTAGLLALTSGVGAAAALQARGSIEEGVAGASAGLAAAGGDRPDEAVRLLERAAVSFSAADADLSRWWSRPALVVPVVGRQVRAMRTMAASGATLSRVGAELLAVADVATTRLRLVEGKTPLDQIVALRRPSRVASTALGRASGRLQSVHSPWLVPPLADRLDRLSRSVAGRWDDARRAALAFDVAPALLGHGGPRRYFLAVQNPAELRASGGFIGSFGEMAVADGRFSLDRTGRVRDLNPGGDPGGRKIVAPADYIARYARFQPHLLWQNVTMSPDFPTVGRAIAGLYPQSGGRAVDGVVAIDPIGLAAILGVVGPVQVPGWPVPLTSENAPRILLHEHYLVLDGEARIDFLSGVVDALWQRLTTTSVSLVELARALGPVVAQKHLVLTSVHTSEQRAFHQLGMAGAMAPTRDDALGVVTQNAGGNKIDWFLRRSVEYRARLEPSTGMVRARARVTLRNEAPVTGLSPFVIGSETVPPLPQGANKLYLSVYSPLLLDGARVDGVDHLLESDLELGRHVYSTYVTIPAGGSVTVELDLVGRIGIGDRYRLQLHRQAFLAPDEVTVFVEVPDGWRADEPRSRVELETDHRFETRVRPSSS